MFSIFPHNTFRIQDDESIVLEFYYMAFIESILARKTLLDYKNLFYPNGYKKKDKIMYT